MTDQERISKLEQEVAELKNELENVKANLRENILSEVESWWQEVLNSGMAPQPN
jgi:hypothetical protein